MSCSSFQSSSSPLTNSCGPSAYSSNLLYKIPDNKELTEIKETQSLYKSNLFKLQMEELIASVSVNYESEECQYIEKFLHKLQDLILSMPSKHIESDFQKSYPLLTFPETEDQAKGFEFYPPRQINVVGSYLLRTNISSALNADISVELPSSIFSPKDYLNYQYVRKRNAYLGEVYNHLTESLSSYYFSSEIFPNIYLHAWNGDIYKPIICIFFSYSSSKSAFSKTTVFKNIQSWVVRIFPVISKNQFKESSLMKHKNLLREKISNHKVIKRNENCAEHDPSLTYSTPYYNSSILEDMRMRCHLLLLNDCSNKFISFRETVLLLKVWGYQRQFFHQQNSSCTLFSGISGFVLSMICAHSCLSNKDVTIHSSSYQLFRICLSFIAKADFVSYIYVMGENQPIKKKLREKENDLNYAYLFDSNECIFNVLWRTQLNIKELQEHAIKSITYLDTLENPFDYIFSVKMSPEMIFDATINFSNILNLLLNEKTSFSLFQLLEIENFNIREYPLYALAFYLKIVIEKSLGDRVGKICIRFVNHSVLKKNFCWNNDDVFKKLLLNAGLSIFLTTTCSINRLLDKGPCANSLESVVFRKFWQDKAETRMFVDGSILECVLWETPSTTDESLFPQLINSEKPSVFTQILKFVLEKKLGFFDCSQHYFSIKNKCKMQEKEFCRFDSNNITTLNKPFLNSINKIMFSLHCTPLGSSLPISNWHKNLMQAYAEFKNRLCSLSGLPLSIKEINFADPSFCYLNVCIPNHLSNKLECDHRTYDVVIQFEASNEWPSENEAASKLKLAFLISMKTELIDDYGISSKINEDYLDIKYSIYIFRVRIFHLNDLVTKIINDSKITYQERLVEQRSLDNIRMLWWRPLTLNYFNVFATTFFAFADTVRLVKLWLYENLMNGFDCVAEHLTAYVYSNPHPFDIPTSPHVGLCRVLYLLCTHDWKKQPLIVNIDLSSPITGNQKEIMERSYESFQSSRNTKCELPTIWISTICDPRCLIMPIPHEYLCNKLFQLAKCARETFKKNTEKPPKNLINWQSLFVPNIHSFDLFINFNYVKLCGVKSPTCTSLEKYINTIQEAFVSFIFYNSLSPHSFIAIKLNTKNLVCSFHNSTLKYYYTFVLNEKKKAVYIPNLLLIISSYIALGNNCIRNIHVIS